MVFLRTSEKTGKDLFPLSYLIRDSCHEFFKSYSLMIVKIYMISWLLKFVYLVTSTSACMQCNLIVIPFFRGMLSKNRSNGWRNWLEVAFDCSTLPETALWCCESIVNFSHLIFFVLSQCHHWLFCH